MAALGLSWGTQDLSVRDFNEVDKYKGLYKVNCISLYEKREYRHRLKYIDRVVYYKTETSDHEGEICQQKCWERERQIPFDITYMWQIDGETMETVTDFIFLGSKITVDGDCNMKLKDACSLEEKLWPT